MTWFTWMGRCPISSKPVGIGCGAIRELVANALVHRDLGPHTLTKRVEIRLLPDRLVIASPGGLWGVSTDQLGTARGESAVNEHLYAICTSLTTLEGARVIEGEGGGIGEAPSRGRDLVTTGPHQNRGEAHRLVDGNRRIGGPLAGLPRTPGAGAGRSRRRCPQPRVDTRAHRTVAVAGALRPRTAGRRWPRRHGRRAGSTRYDLFAGEVVSIPSGQRQERGGYDHVDYHHDDRG